MLETPEEMANLQALLDASMATAGPHLRDIADDHRLSATELTERLQGMRLLVLGTVTADGRPLRGARRRLFPARDLLVQHRAAGCATAPPGPTACLQRDAPPGGGARRHGARQGRVLALDDPANAELRQAMLDEYLPRVGPDFEQGLDAMDAVGVRIAPEKMFTFHMDGEPPPAGA